MFSASVWEREWEWWCCLLFLFKTHCWFNSIRALFTIHFLFGPMSMRVCKLRWVTSIGAVPYEKKNIEINKKLHTHTHMFDFNHLSSSTLPTLNGHTIHLILFASTVGFSFIIWCATIRCGQNYAYAENKDPERERRRKRVREKERKREGKREESERRRVREGKYVQKEIQTEIRQ